MAFAAGIALIGVIGAAAPLRQDLGEGLRYFRAHAMPSDLPGGDVKPGALVLDLRFARGGEAGATALDAWLKFRSTPHTPVLVLVNADTAPALAAALSSDHGMPGLILLGLAAANPKPDIAVDTTAEADRRSYDALEQGGSLPALITENADKPRNDEAALAREHANAVTPDDAGDDGTDAATTDEAAAVNVPAHPRPVIDRVLQRAVQVHRTLKALRRL